MLYAVQHATPSHKRYDIDQVLQIRGGGANQDPVVGLELEATRDVLLGRGARESAIHGDGALTFEGLDNTGMGKFLAEDTLEEASAITKLNEDNLVLVANVVGPATDGHTLVFEFGTLANLDLLGLWQTGVFGEGDLLFLFVLLHLLFLDLLVWLVEKREDVYWNWVASLLIMLVDSVCCLFWFFLLSSYWNLFLFPYS